MRLKNFTLADLATATGGRLRGCDARFAGSMPVARIVTDSRLVEPGDVFWALPGSRHDGRDFIGQAIERGAAGIVAAAIGADLADVWSLAVGDSLAALWALADHRRQRFHGTVVAVTGSVGKSTTREMIHSVLGARFHGVASPRNFNNRVGLPLSMLSLDEAFDYAVFEIGASAAGEIDQLARLCSPHVAVITQIAEAHLASFGSLAGVAQAKAEILAGLPASGLAVVNGDCPLSRKATAQWSGKSLAVGKGADCDLTASDVVARGGELRFRVHNQSFTVPVWGRHHLPGALAAIAVGRAAGIPLPEIAAALAAFEPLEMRCEVRECGPITVVNDAYNACPASMRAALELLRDVDDHGRKVFVCGDMCELGAATGRYHRQLGQQVVSVCGADLLVTVGQLAADVAAAAIESGMRRDCVVVCDSPAAAHNRLAERLEPGDVVLVKGSRAMGLEALADWIEQEAWTNHDWSIAPEHLAAVA